MPGTATRLIGRKLELDRIERALEALDRAPGPVLQIVGEPGIGKTRLLAEAAVRARERGQLVFSGRAAEFERQAPFGVIVDALDAYLESQNPSRYRTLGVEQREELAGVFPALGELANRGAETLQHERYRAHHAVRRLIELLAADRPCALILDDMHWADQSSLELLSHLLRRRPAAPVLTLIAFRPPEAPERLRAALVRAEREGVSERLELRPLAAAEADELLGANLDRPLREELYRRTGGNPFYLEQLARAAGRGDPVPRRVTESIEGELGVLSGRVRGVLRAAAVAGDPFTPGVAAAAADLSEADALEALDELLALDLVRPGVAPVEFRFRHPIVRAAVYESAPAAWRLGAHARAATHLQQLGAPAIALAHHVERSALPGDERAVALLADAGHAAAPRAPATAATWFAAALRLLPADGDDPNERLQLLVPLARSLGASGQLEASREALGELLELLPVELGVVRGQVIAFMSLVQHLLGRHGEARETLEVALAGLPDPRSAEAASLRVELAADCFFLGEWDGMHRWAASAVPLAREVAEPRVHAAAAALLGLSCYELQRPAEAREHVAEAREIVDGLSDDELALRVDACHWLGWAEHLLDEYEESIRHMERGIAISRLTGQGHVLAPMTIGLVIANTWQGRLDEAGVRADQAIEIAHLAGSDQLMAWAQTMRCWVSVRQGDLDEAILAGEEAVRIGHEVTNGPYTVVASCWLADALIESGEAKRGRELLLAAVEGPDLPKVEPAFRSCIYEVLTRAELALGAVDAADRWAQRARLATDGLGLPGRESFARRAEAEVALKRGECERATELALSAAEQAGSGYRVDAARARLLAGRALAASGEPDQAVAELKTAREELEECGARRYRDQAVRELRRLGVRIGRGGRRAPAAAGSESLSDREREVAALVRDRLTNREIAERLVLSEKTIERHLSRIFQKLDLSSRVELARMIERAETAAPRG